MSRLLLWAERREGRVVGICNTHSVVTAHDDPLFGAVLQGADMNTADGAPVAWFMRLSGARGQQRINGPDLMWRTCQALDRAGAPSIFLYGNTEDTNRRLEAVLRTRFPDLTIAGSISPPFRDLTAEETAQHIAHINRSGAGIVWVSLGCPKQEVWMAKSRESVHAVMVGVGAAFDYHAGTIKRAPLWMQRAGLEWVHRLASEPRRLWRRYLYNNTQFVLRAVQTYVRRR
ncbi:WecB/TagA/CpsF family glycosyltransferase [Ideonella alba]|uniref:WecB/TagA/CpsF family glycosyltransferase n=1 Tax=Ideonella alba TaxID=2824118 RepID=UPI002873B967|nr:WecB/TagA/CpsF family glycosyltransferase [Ideonella alba]